MKTTSTSILLLILLFCCYGYSSEKSESGVLIIGSSRDGDQAFASEPISQDDALLYDASELPLVKSDRPSREGLLSGIAEQYRVYVEDFTADELEIFLKKKSSYKEQVASAMRKLKLSEERIVKVMDSLDSQFYKSSRLLLEANATGGQYKFLVRTGLAFNSAFLQKYKISQTRFMQYLSSKKGYFYLYAGGFGISRVVNPATKKSHLILDLNVTKEDLKSVTSVVAEAATVDILVLGATLEVRKGNFDSVLFESGRVRKTGTYLGPAGRVVRDQSTLSLEFPLSISFVTSLSLPPIASGIAFFDSNVTVYRYSLNLSQLHPKAVAEKIWGLLKRQEKQNFQCLSFYAK
ncbi:MAG: hypothetical protein JNM24_11725 [Bdellovibrionaceae bacterium]|nr:hypothetical protein [Pseudobdellovibrionaceae bacterium]